MIAPAWRELASILASRMVMMLGKGGVGKTTMSIAVALALAETGRKVLLASLDPAKHLLEYLRLPGPQRRVKVAENLYAVQYDVDAYASRVADELALTLKRVMPGLSVLNVDDVVKTVRDAPGFEEEVLLRVIEELHGSQEYDAVVVDTPPTGVTLRVLGLPRLYLAWIDSLRRLRESIVALRYTIARALGKKVEPRDPVLDKLAELRGRYERLARMLASRSATAYIVVATPEPLPVYEAEVTARKLAAMGNEPTVFIANRVLGEMAERIGTAEVERESLAKLNAVRCSLKSRPPLLLVRQAPKPPRSLGDVEALVRSGAVELVRSC